MSVVLADTSGSKLTVYSAVRQRWLFNRGKGIKPKLRNKFNPSTKDTLKRMSRSIDGLSQSNSEHDFLEMLTRAQGNRFESQRSPYPSPVLPRVEPRAPGTTSQCSGEDDRDGPKETSPAPFLSTGSCASSEGADTPNGVVADNQLCQSGDSFGSPSKSLTYSTTFSQCPSPSVSNRQSVDALKLMLQEPGPYPLIATPPEGGYKVVNGEYASSMGSDGQWQAPEISTEHFRVDLDTVALLYGRHFVGRNHSTYIAHTTELGPLVLSFMNDDITESQTKMILRTQEKTAYKTFPSQNSLTPEYYLTLMANSLNDDNPVTIESFAQVASPKVHQLVQKFDEHSVAKQHKFGVIYQKFGQTTEEEMFCNNEHTPALAEFLELIGDKVTLKGFEKYRGGLDICRNQTGEHSIYTDFQGQEIMFHVSTLLPFDSSDSQQVGRKRHIGNDIVAIVFQDQNTPFSPDCVRSHFLHAYIVVQVEHPNTDQTVYKVAVATKDDVPDFEPPLPDPAVFSKDCDFREWLLTKLLNAEFKCHQAPDFRRLATRTRTQLFTHLVEDLSDEMDVSIDKRRNSAMTTSSQEAIFNSPRRRTFGALFMPRKKTTGASPKIPERTLLTSEDSSPHSPLTASTPDLSSIGQMTTSLPVNGHAMKPRLNRPFSVDPDGQKGKRKFTLGKKAKKPKRRSHTTDAINELQTVEKKSDTLPTNSGHSNEAQPSSAMNWSVPEDLPGVVAAGSPTSSQAPSLDNMFFSLSPNSLARVEHYASNPDIMHAIDNMDPGHFIIVRPQSTAGRGPVHSFEAAVQVGAKEEVQRYPSPSAYSSSVGSSVPGIRYISPSLSSSSISNSRHGTPIRSSSDRDNTPVQTKGRENMRLRGTSEPRQVAKYQILSGHDQDDASDEDDDTYESLMQSLQSLTAEVTNLREEQLRLYKQNTKLSSQKKKWQIRYEQAQGQLQMQERLIEELRQRVTIAEEGTEL